MDAPPADVTADVTADSALRLVAGGAGEVALTVVLDRPDRQNTITAALVAGLHRVLDRAEEDPACRAVVLRGTGGIFCGGMDFAETVGDEQGDERGDEQDDVRRGGAEFLGLLKRFTTAGVVVVSEVDGRVSGGGVGLVAASDLVYATPRSVFSLPEALWGLLPCCVLPFLVRRTGFRTAATMTLTTQALDAARAVERGLVDEVVDEVGDGPTVADRRLLARLGKIDPETIAAAKTYLDRLWILSPDTDRVVLDEFARVLSAPAVRERLADHVATGRFPWERA